MKIPYSLKSVLVLSLLGLSVSCGPLSHETSVDAPSTFQSPTDIDRNRSLQLVEDKQEILEVFKNMEQSSWNTAASVQGVSGAASFDLNWKGELIADYEITFADNADAQLKELLKKHSKGVQVVRVSEVQKDSDGNYYFMPSSTSGDRTYYKVYADFGRITLIHDKINLDIRKVN